MPGVGFSSASRVLLEAGDGSAFISVARLATYDGVAPATHRSSSSIRGEPPGPSGSRKFNRGIVPVRAAAFRNPTSRAYYDRKRAEARQPNAASIYLDRCRCDVFPTMHKNGPHIAPHCCRRLMKPWRHPGS